MDEDGLNEAIRLMREEALSSANAERHAMDIDADALEAFNQVHDDEFDRIIAEEEEFQNEMKMGGFLSRFSAVEEGKIGVFEAFRAEEGAEKVQEDQAQDEVDESVQDDSMEESVEERDYPGVEELQRNYRSLRFTPLSDFISISGIDQNLDKLYLQVFKHSEIDLQLRKWKKFQSESKRKSKTHTIEDLLAEIHVMKLENKENNPDVDVSSKSTNHELWVEKYTPKVFRDLLSDNKVNRDLLKWLNSWKKVVFENSSDPLDYPEHPIVLLAGPPGLGKTTLAKLIAHISGYSLTEVNSSDDRSANTMARILSDATGTHTAFGSRKPRCLILDEIDGATGGDEKSAIAELLKFLKKGRSIQRPIICIANDFFAKSLRPLRQSTHVKIFRLGMPRQETMVSRLQYICRLEGIKADFTSLCSLCDRSDFDIRCCLNILQFVQSSKNGQLLDISSLPIGTKDMATEMFDVLKAIFHKPIYSVTKSEKKTSHFDQVWKAVDSNSDYDSVLAAVHENYPSSGYLDPTLERTADIADWFALSDIITTSSYRGMNSHIESLYAPMVSTVVSLHCSSRHSKRHVFPKSMHQHRQAKYRNEQILSNFYSNSVHCYSLGFRGDGLVLDVLPLLISILNPAAKFRPRVQGAALVTEEVQTVFSSIIETMLSLGLSYRKGSISSDSNEKLADEATSSVIKLSLYPEIDTLLQFEGLPQHNFLTEEIKQMISREIHMESIKRTTIPAVGEIPRNESTVVPESSQDLTVEKVTQTDSNLDLSKKRKTVCLNDALVLNGRKKRLPRRKHDIRYKFLEGFTNAVRRPVDISTFL